MTARRTFRVLATKGFAGDLDRIERFFDSARDLDSMDRLLDDLESHVIPLLENTPRIGAPLQTQRLPADARLVLERIEERLRAHEARTLVRSDFIVLYLVGTRAVHLVSVRHHREGRFKFGALPPL